MSDIQMITPKKTKVDIMNILNSYSFSDEEINRLKYIYTKEWEAYKKGISKFLENQGEEILNIEGMSLMLSKITSNKPDSDYEYKEKLFSEEKHSIFCQWLFKSHIMALENCDRKIGNHIDHHLPIILHLYLNEGRAKRLQDPNLDMQFKIDDYNKLSDLIIDKINEYLGEFYEIDIMEPITTEGPFDHIVANLKMVTIYQQSEDTYIKTFLNSLMNKINETSSIESFTRSEELFGLFKDNSKSQEVGIVDWFVDGIVELCGEIFKIYLRIFGSVIISVVILFIIVKLAILMKVKIDKKRIIDLMKSLDKKDVDLLKKYFRNIEKDFSLINKDYSNFIKQVDKRLKLKGEIKLHNVTDASFISKIVKSIKDKKIQFDIENEFKLGFSINCSGYYEDDGIYSDSDQSNETYDTIVPEIEKYLDNMKSRKLLSSNSVIKNISHSKFIEDDGEIFTDCEAIISYSSEIKPVISKIINYFKAGK